MERGILVIETCGKERCPMAESVSQSSTTRIVRVPANNASNAVYGLGLIGSAIYFIQHAASFWIGVLGILKAIIWPVFIVYKALEYFHL
jgi:hypothetical protein